jgi:hypothetical protein
MKLQIYELTKITKFVFLANSLILPRSSNNEGVLQPIPVAGRADVERVPGVVEDGKLGPARDPAGAPAGEVVVRRRRGDRHALRRAVAREEDRAGAGRAHLAGERWEEAAGGVRDPPQPAVLARDGAESAGPPPREAPGAWLARRSTR